eukprot:5752164-Karenia_brevis.AAC.1
MEEEEKEQPGQGQGQGGTPPERAKKRTRRTELPPPPGMVVKETVTDGNCLPDALAKAFSERTNGSGYNKLQVRALIAQHLRKH